MLPRNYSKILIIFFTCSSGADINIETQRIQAKKTPAFESTSVESQAKPPIEAVRNIPSVQVLPTGGEASEPKVFFRGMDGSQNRYYWQGIPLTQTQFQTGSYALIPDTSISNIDYFTENHSQILSEGLGGAISFRAPDFDEKNKSLVQLRIGSYQYFKLNSVVQTRAMQFPFRLHTQFIKSEENFSYWSDNGTPTDPADDSWQVRAHNRFYRVSLVPQVELYRNKTSELNFIGLGAYQAIEIPGDAQNPAFGDFSETLAVGGMTWRKKWSEETESKLLTFAKWNGQKLLGSAMSSVQPTELNQTHVGLRWNLKNRILSWDQALEYENAKTQYPIAQTRTGRWYFPVSLSSAISISNLLLEPEILAGVLVYNQSYLLASPKLKAKFKILNSLQLQAGIGYYQRPPSLLELNGSPQGVSPNDQLTSEKAYRAHATLEYAIHKSLISLGVFTTQVEDLILSVQAGPQTIQFTNVGLAKIQGVDLGFKSLLFNHFTFNTSLSYLSAKNETDVPYQLGKELPGRSAWSLKTQLRFDKRPWGLVYFTSLRSPYFMDFGNFQKVEGYWDHNFEVSFQTAQLGTFGLEILNLTDITNVPFEFGSATSFVSQSGVQGYPSPGRRIYLNWRYEL